MYCVKCGEKNKKDNKFCVKCGTLLTEEVKSQDNNELNNIKIISVLSLVCAFIIFPVGLVLSIIGLIKNGKYKRKTGEKTNYNAFNIAGLIVSIFELLITLVVIIIIIGIFSSTGLLNNAFEGSYKCKKGQYTYIYSVNAKFDNNKLTWSKYGDEDKNILEATYYVNKRNFDNNTLSYSLKVTPYYYMINGIESSNYNKNTTMDININSEDVTIEFGNGSKYYCDKIDD